MDELLAHECNVNCSRVNEWGNRIAKSIKQEKSWEAKCRETRLIEMKSDDPEINAVPAKTSSNEP